jgi:HPr kinase/phosphorylase
LADVYGLGVLIRGSAGIGKSECALELVKRGHIFVADDIVEIERRRGDTLLGSCPNVLKHYMEVRGLGIIDVELLFGVGSVLEQSNIEMEVQLVPAGKQSVCDRTGLDQKISTILGVEIPSVCMPVTPGRNLAVLIEVAALNQRLKAEGIFAAKEFNSKLLKQIKKSAKKCKK